MTTLPVEPGGRKLSVLHALVVGAAVLGFLFVLCWAGDAIGVDRYAPTTHRFVSIFTSSPETSSPAALAEGLPWAIVFGAVAGAALALFANAFRFLGR